MIRNRTALVTGGAGFIGSHLTHGLLQEGWAVRILDNFSSGFRRNLEPFGDDIEVIEGDIRDSDACREACRGVDSVFHLAAMVSVVESVQDPLLSNDVTLRGSLNILDAAKNAGARRLILSSSAAVYGNADSVPTTEDQAMDPQSPYAADKAAAESYCRIYHSLYGLETTVLRYFNVYGPRQSITSGYAAVIPSFINAVTSGRRPIIYGDGEQTRDFVFVTDVVAANLLAATSPKSGGPYNVATGRGTSLLELLDCISRITGCDSNPLFEQARDGEIRHSRAEITSIEHDLGFTPTTSLYSGLRTTIESASMAPV